MKFRIFKFVTYDIQPINGQSVISFFKDSNEYEESVVSETEDQIVRSLLSHRHFRSIFIGEFFDHPHNVMAFAGVRESFVVQHQKPGDIDILLDDPDKPNKSIAFEVKRVKAYAIDESTSRVNGSERLKKGILQVNKYQSLGFHQSYFLLVVLNDARGNKSSNIMLRAVEGPECRASV